jgi:hypothetical protein
MYSKPQGLLQALDKVRKADAAESTMKKPGRLEPLAYAKPQGLVQALDKVRKADAAETTLKKPNLLQQAFQKAKDSIAAEAVSDAPRGAKAFTRMKAAAAEAESIAADEVMKRLKPQRLNIMPKMTVDVLKTTPVGAKSPKSPKSSQSPKVSEQTEVAEKPNDGEKYFRLMVQTGPVEPVGEYREKTPRLPYVEQKRSIGKNAATGSHARVGTRTNEWGEIVYTEYCGWKMDKYGRVYPTADGEIVVIKSFHAEKNTYLVDIVNPPADEPWYNVKCLRFHAECLREL